MISLESPIARPSISSTGKVWLEPPVSSIEAGMCRPGIETARRLCGTRLWSSAQRAFSLKCETPICQRVGRPSLPFGIDAA
jgi:hypothetical protein